MCKSETKCLTFGFTWMKCVDESKQNVAFWQELGAFAHSCRGLPGSAAHDSERGKRSLFSPTKKGARSRNVHLQCVWLTFARARAEVGPARQNPNLWDPPDALQSFHSFFAFSFSFAFSLQFSFSSKQTKYCFLQWSPAPNPNGHVWLWSAMQFLHGQRKPSLQKQTYSWFVF